MYIRGKRSSQYAVFNYFKIKIKEIDKFHYSAVLNITQIAI